MFRRTTPWSFMASQRIRTILMSIRATTRGWVWRGAPVSRSAPHGAAVGVGAAAGAMATSISTTITTTLITITGPITSGAKADNGNITRSIAEMRPTVIAEPPIDSVGADRVALGAPDALVASVVAAALEKLAASAASGKPVAAAESAASEGQ